MLNKLQFIVLALLFSITAIFPAYADGTDGCEKFSIKMSKEKTIIFRILKKIKKIKEEKKTIEPKSLNSELRGLDALYGSSRESYVIWGMTDFLINRAKEELNQSFIVKIKKWFDDNSCYKELLINTYNVIQTIDFISYRSVLPTLQDAIKKDIDNLPVTLNECLENSQSECSKKFSSLDQKSLNMLYTFASALKSLDEIKEGKAPFEALSCLMESLANNIKDDTIIKNAIIIGIISRELQYYSKTVLIDVIKQNNQDFFSFLNSDLEDSCLKDSINSFNVTSKDKNKIELIIINVAENLNENLEKLKEQEAKLKEQKTKLQAAKDENKEAARQDYTISYVDYLKSYADIIISLAFISDNNKKQNYEIASQAALDIHQAIIEKNYNQVILPILSLTQALPKTPELSPKTKSFILFISNLAGAKSSDEVAEVLNCAANPVGSFRQKRIKPEENWDFQGLFINAYLGASYGDKKILKGESLDTNQATVADKSSSHIGLTLPVGIEAAWGTSFYCKYIPVINYINSISLFASVIDLGTLADYRINSSDETEQDPVVGFEQIIAPGGFIVLGITRDYPISLGFGYQYIPHLRKLASDDSEIGVNRVSFFLALDLTLFNL